jgi:hypothetical protein
MRRKQDCTWLILKAVEEVIMAFSDEEMFGWKEQEISHNTLIK